jgi:hypothetical protein
LANRDYFKGPEQVERNRAWRKKHPRGTGRGTGSALNLILNDLSTREEGRRGHPAFSSFGRTVFQCLEKREKKFPIIGRIPLGFFSSQEWRVESA